MNDKSLRRAAVLALLALAVAASSFFKPVRVWASQEGSYIYHLILVRGPLYVSASPAGLSQGLYISTVAYTSGASSTGDVTQPGGNITLSFRGAYTTATRPACATALAGTNYYDTTVNSMAFCDGTNYHKLVTGSATNDSWTSF